MMDFFRQPIRAASFILIGIGVLLLGLNLLLGGTLNISLPLVFLMLGGGFIILVVAARQRWPLTSLLFIPGAFMLALGTIFLLNVLTGDWSSWSYAWLLLVAAVGLGMVLASRRQNWHVSIPLIGWILLLAGLTFFAVFGAIAGGVLIQIMAPMLLILGGLALRWGKVERYLPETAARRLHLPEGAEAAQSPARSEPLVEPLSARELEVLALVDQGLSNQQIALRLNVAASTVKTHINNIYGKLGVQTRVQALSRARDLRLL